jgi:hypothetical protein
MTSVMPVLGAGHAGQRWAFRKPTMVAVHHPACEIEAMSTLVASSRRDGGGAVQREQPFLDLRRGQAVERHHEDGEQLHHGERGTGVRREEHAAQREAGQPEPDRRVHHLGDPGERGERLPAQHPHQADPVQGQHRAEAEHQRGEVREQGDLPQVGPDVDVRHGQEHRGPGHDEGQAGQVGGGPAMSRARRSRDVSCADGMIGRCAKWSTGCSRSAVDTPTCIWWSPTTAWS